MTLAYKDCVKESVSSGPGTGTLTLTGAVTGYQSATTAGLDGKTAAWRCEAVDGNGNPSGLWEVFEGVFTASGTTLTRVTVRDGSSGPGVKANFTGACNVFLVANATSISLFPDPTVFKGVLWGLTLSNDGSDAVNDIDIAAGVAVDSGQAAFMKLTSALVKRLDASWTVGTNQGGLDTGSIGNNWYHVWLIRRSDTGVVDVLFSLSATAPTMPTSYDQKCRIGAFVRVAAAILAFKQFNDTFMFATTVQDLSTTEGTTSSLRTMSVPGGVNVQWIGMCYSQRSGATSATYLSSPDRTDEAAAFVAPMNLSQGTFNNAGAMVGMGGQLSVWTNTSSQIRSVSFAAATTIRLGTIGWVDPRGKY